MRELIKVYKLKLLLEDFHDLFLGESNKLKKEVRNFMGNLILLILIMPIGLGLALLHLGHIDY